MDQSRQAKLERFLDKQHYVLTEAVQYCKDKEEATFVICCAMQDTLRKFHNVLYQFVGSDDAKATLKMTLDTVIMDYGLAVAYMQKN